MPATVSRIERAESNAHTKEEAIQIIARPPKRQLIEDEPPKPMRKKKGESSGAYSVSNTDEEMTEN